MVVERIKRLWRIATYFALAKEKTWRWPRQSKVLVFDAAGEDVLREYLQPWAPEVLHVRGEKICMPVLFASLFKSGRKTDAYIDAFIERVRPQLIVTFIDNNPGFYLLPQRHGGIRTMSIQNGIKSYYFDIFESWDIRKSSCDCGAVTKIMTFGSRIGWEYKKYIQGDAVPMGSLKSNLYPRNKNTTGGTIAFVSQYRESLGIPMGDRFVSHKDYFEQPDRIVLDFLGKYAEKRRKTIIVVPYSNRLTNDAMFKREQAYYSQWLGENFAFSERNGPSSCYDAVDSAEVVVAIDSALGYESAARKNKTAIFAIRSYLLGVVGLSYGWPEAYPDEGPFWSNRPDPEAFERILDHLFDIDDDEWRSELSECGFDSVMTYDPENKVLQAVLQEELGPLPPSLH
jgi:surface carbohydrate biosynthesis protein